MRGTERLLDISPSTFVLQPPRLGEEPVLASPRTQVTGRERERKTEVLGTGGALSPSCFLHLCWDVGE